MSIVIKIKYKYSHDYCNIFSITRISSAINRNSTDVFFELYALNNITYNYFKGHKEI